MKNNSLDSENIELALNSFVRRTQHTERLKELIKLQQGKLSRKGRSRNWKLTLPFNNKQDLIDELYSADETSWLWLAKKLAEYTVQYEQQDLLNLLHTSPSMTINELMKKTNCSIKEARLALDEFEWQK